MNPERKTLLTSAFEALGSERVTRGLTAKGHSWSDCFLALAIDGGSEVLDRELSKRWRKEHFVGTLLGVRVQVVTEVVRAWDHDEDGFRALAAEWLELNRVATLGQAGGLPVSDGTVAGERNGPVVEGCAHSEGSRCSPRFEATKGYQPS